MKAVRSSETSGSNYVATRLNIPQVLLARHECRLSHPAGVADSLLYDLTHIFRCSLLCVCAIGPTPGRSEREFVWKLLVNNAVSPCCVCVCGAASQIQARDRFRLEVWQEILLKPSLSANAVNKFLTRRSNNFREESTIFYLF